jgi:hypothetical protein
LANVSLRARKTFHVFFARLASSARMTRRGAPGMASADDDRIKAIWRQVRSRHDPTIGVLCSVGFGQPPLVGRYSAVG